MVLPKVDLDVRKIDREIALSEVDSIRDYLNINCIDIAYDKMPEELRRIGPTKAPLYTRTYSITFIEAEPEKKEDGSEIDERYESSIQTIKRFEQHVESLHGKKRECAEAFRETYEHNGRRLADNIRIADKDIASIENEGVRLPKLILKLVALRVPTSVGTYGIFEGPLGEAQVDIAGMKLKGKDMAAIAGGLAFGLTSVGGYFWSRKKINDFRNRLRGSIATVYRQAVLEAVDDLFAYYPESIIELRPQAGKMLAEVGKAKAYRLP